MERSVAEIGAAIAKSPLPVSDCAIRIVRPVGDQSHVERGGPRGRVDSDLGSGLLARGEANRFIAGKKLGGRRRSYLGVAAGCETVERSQRQKRIKKGFHSVYLSLVETLPLTAGYGVVASAIFE